MSALAATHDNTMSHSTTSYVDRGLLKGKIFWSIPKGMNCGSTSLRSTQPRSSKLASALLFANRKIIVERVAAMGMPAMYKSPMEGEEGGLIAYGPSLVQLYRDIFARQLARLLRGAKPADLPIEQPTKFELAINLKTAKALGLKIPKSFLVRADKVLE